MNDYLIALVVLTLALPKAIDKWVPQHLTYAVLSALALVVVLHAIVIHVPH